jgi:hypothetical protein
VRWAEENHRDWSLLSETRVQAGDILEGFSQQMHFSVAWGEGV